MRSQRVLAALVALGTLMTISGSTLASPPSVPQLINFQARVNAAGGTPVADGAYGVSFSLYTHSSGGTFLWSETVANQSVSGGTFTHALGSVVALPLHLEEYDSLWVEVIFDGEIQSPRVHLTSTPSAQIAAALELPSNSNPTANAVETRWDLHGMSQNGADGGEQIRLWGPTWGELLMSDWNISGIADPVQLTSNGGAGGMLVLRQPSGTDGVSLQAHTGGTGGSLWLTDPFGLSTIYMNAGLTGDDRVQLFNDAINALECANEPGVASSADPTSTPLAAGFNTLRTRTINCPSAGYVLALGSAQASVTHVNGTNSVANFGVSTASNSFPLSQDVELRISTNAPSGAYSFPVAVQTVFPVAAGAQTFYFLGQLATGTVAAAEPTLSLVFLPTAYGTVSTPSAELGHDDLTSTGDGSPLTEPQQAQEFELARLRRELDTVREQAEFAMRRLAEIEAAMPKRQALTPAGGQRIDE